MRVGVEIGAAPAMVKYGEQILPAACSGIALGDRTDRLWPRDPEIGVERGDANVLLGSMRPIDAVADVGDRCQRLEAVKESGRDVEMTKVDVVQQERLVHAERG